MASSLPAGSKVGQSQDGGTIRQLTSFLEECSKHVCTDEAQKWGVYVLKPSAWFKHHSLLFEWKENMSRFYFSVELLKFPVEDDVGIRARFIDLSSLKDSLKAAHLGDVTMDVQSILTKAWVTLKSMRCYDAMFNNCQDYCKALAKNLGCSNYKNDREKVVAVGALAVGVSGLAYLLYKLYSKDNNK